MDVLTDQILNEAEFGLTEREVLPAFGLDHYPVPAGLCLSPEAAELQNPPAIEECDLHGAAAWVEAAHARRSRG